MVQSARLAGQRSRETPHGRVLVELGPEPLVELCLRAGGVIAACLAAKLLGTGGERRRPPCALATARRPPSSRRRHAPGSSDRNVGAGRDRRRGWEDATDQGGVLVCS